MADEGTEPMELSEVSVERVAGRLAELVAPQLLSQNPAGLSSHTTDCFSIFTSIAMAVEPGRHAG